MPTITREFIITFDDADFHVPRAVLAARVAYLVTMACEGAAPQHYIRALGYEIDTPDVKIANGWRFSFRNADSRAVHDLGIAVAHLVDHACEAYTEARDPPAPAETANRWSWWDYDPEKDDDPPAAAPWYPDDSPGWTEWGGGECPIDPSTRVVVLLRLRRLYLVRDALTGRADMWTWRHTGGAGDIVAYRVVDDK